MRYLGLLYLVLIAFAAAEAKAQDDAILARGDAVVTGFSGTKPADQLDEVFIDPDGASARIMRLEPGAPPVGQLIAAPSVLQVKARDVGQVFAIGLDDRLLPNGTQDTPNIYLGATSAFGLQIVAPDADGDGRPERLKKGDAKAQWMQGQFGNTGGPGSIYKVDGKTGAVSLFTTIQGNSGPGLGDIVFDSATRQFFVSDLDTGLIHRLDSAGTLIDSFDHGQTGRPAMGLPAVADDGAAMDIKSPAFDSENSATWGFTQPERLVWGLAFRAGRLYYAAAGPEIWSISINLDGSFGGDPRREIEVSGTPNNHPISDIAFDARDHMYVAQRGGIKGSYDYSVFADAKQSVVFRFMREIPDDPVTPGIWVPIPDEYAVGFPPDHRNTSGGVALGYGYDQSGVIRPGACDMTLWATGDSLLSNAVPTQDAAAQGETVVHGLQGADLALTRPDNEPPAQSWFVDYDGQGNDPQSQGHVGDVEIWQPCERGVDTGAYEPAADVPPGYFPPGGAWPEDGVPPDYFPPDGGVPPEDVPPDGTPDWTYNLRLEKRPLPNACVAGGLGFLCDYVMRVTNTGPDAYVGPIVINDALPAAPAGAVMTFTDIPPWFCFAISPTEQQCTYGPAALLPGESIDLHVTVDLPVAGPVCHLDNQAELVWPWGLGDIDPSDDFDLATAMIPAPQCPPPGGEKTNLKISKHPLKDVCTDKGAFFECPYQVVVRNIGAGIYNGLVKVDDTIPAGATATFAPASWNCAGPAPTYSCQRGPVVLLPGQAVSMNAIVKVPKNLAGPLQCQAKNAVKITEAAGGTDQNTDPTDDDADATMILPGELAQCPNLDPMSNLKLKKTGPDKKCPVSGNDWMCEFTVTLQNFGKAYASPIQFIDALPFGSPAGATVSFQPPAGWNCGQVFGTLYQCNSDNPDLAHLEKVEIPATVKIPVAPVAKCEVTNNAQIIKAPGGTLLNSFAGDDAGSAKAQLSAAYPQGGGQGICVQSNLKLKKTGPAGPCPVAGGNWECKFNVTVQNFGSPYKSPIQFVDGLPVGTPPGATASFQPPAGWNCGQVFGNLYQCKSNNPNLAHLGKAEIPVTVKIPVAPVAKCEITNNAKVVKAQGGTAQNTFAGDDASSAKAQLAPVFPMGGGQGICLAANMDQSEPPLTTPEGKESNLTITKTASASQVTTSGQDATFTITVTNEGPGVFNAPIEIRDTLFDGQTVEPSNGSWPAPWTCEGQSMVGHPEQGICKHPQVKLDPGESVVLALEIEAPNSFIAPSGSTVRCGYKNKAEILRPAPGSPKNVDAGDDVAFAAVKFAPFEMHGKTFCEPGLTSDPGRERNLTIAKTAGASQATAGGQNTTFTITVTNQGPGVHNGEIVLRDTLFDGAIVEPSNGSWSPPWVCEGQSMVGHPEQGICTHPPILLNPGESVELELEIEAPNSFVAPSGSQVKCGYKNKIEILEPAGGTPQNTNAGDDTAFAEAKFAPFDLHGTTFCGLGLTTPPVSQACPQGWSRTPIQGKCCPPRSSWDGERCKRDVKPPEEKCPAGYTGTPPNCHEIDVPQGCKAGMELIKGECRCPRGTRFIDGKCRTPSSGPEESCGPDEVGAYPNCRCARGFTGVSPNCRPIVCPSGTRGKFPDCRKIDCPANQQWIDGACRCAYPLKWNGKRCIADTPKTCPADSVGNYPNCRCKRGTAGTPGNCQRIVEPKKCPADSVGNYPNCRCKRGTAGTPGNCQRIVEPKKCPADSVGNYPNCRCKRGMVGKPGNCQRIVDEPRKCPEGFRGAPPNCRRIIDPPRRLCPPGFRGRPPNCKQVGTNPL